MHVSFQLEKSLKTSQKIKTFSQLVIDILLTRFSICFNIQMRTGSHVSLDDAVTDKSNEKKSVSK